MRGRAWRWSLGLALAAIVAACSPGARYGAPLGMDLPATPQRIATAPSLPPAQGEVIGTGPVRVALILPLTGHASSVGRSMANGARLGMEHALSVGGHGIHLVLKDSGGTAQGARSASQQAVAEGARLILGPLTAEAVASAGAMARASRVPLIGFSSTANVATDGVYLMSVLPEAEIMRALGYARAQDTRSVGAIIPDTPLGRVQAEALRQAAGEMGLEIAAIDMFADEAMARLAVERMAPAMRSGQIDTLYLPDSATAPSFALLLEAARVPRQSLTILGSADWEGDGAIWGQPYLAGAAYPAIDPNGLAALAPQYQARFGAAPHPFATLAFSAVLLANTPSLSQAMPPFGNGLLAPGGFSGRDGPFRFHFDGRGEYGLVMRQVQPGGATTIEAARLGGLPLARDGGMMSVDAAIPAAAEFR